MQPELFDDGHWRPRADTSDTGRRKPRKAAPRMTYTRRHGGARRLCDDCTADIHARGVGVAPYPMSARWVRKAPGEEPLGLCEQHKRERVEGGR